MSDISGGLVHEMPVDLARALSAGIKTTELWGSLTPIARNEFICSIEDAKQAKSRVKRINRTLGSFLKARDGQVAFIVLTKSPANGSKMF